MEHKTVRLCSSPCDTAVTTTLPHAGTSQQSHPHKGSPNNLVHPRPKSSCKDLVVPGHMYGSWRPSQGIRQERKSQEWMRLSCRGMAAMLASQSQKKIPKTRVYIQTLVTTTGFNQAWGQQGGDPSSRRPYLPCQHPWPFEQTNARVCFASVQAQLVRLTNSLSPFFWDYVFNSQQELEASSPGRQLRAVMHLPGSSSPQGPAARLPRPPPLAQVPTKCRSFFPCRARGKRTFVRSDLQLVAGSFPWRA